MHKERELKILEHDPSNWDILRSFIRSANLLKRKREETK